MEEGLSLRLFREFHGVLLTRGWGSNQIQGEFRRSQNWIGGTRPGNAVFVPPPAEEALECMSKLELFSHDQLNGDFYGSLLPLVEAMETAERHLSATVVCRALLDSMLRRGQTRTYPHGIRYLKKLDRLAQSVSDWCGLNDHNTHQPQLRQTHGREFSFWSQYGK